MKKNYITPEINVIQLEALCDGGIQVASIYKGKLTDKCIGNFEVIDEEKTKTATEYKDLWGETNSGKWGDD